VPSYLEASMSNFTKDQERIRETMTSMVGKTPTEMMAASQSMIEEQTKRNMELFQNAMSVFNPFAAAEDEAAAKKAAEEDSSDIKSMKEQIAAMQRKLDDLE
ncbi:MAG: polyhydroxyalkanoate synthesis repressor PhaR, partial [Pseudomonadota bacterium]